MEADRGVNPIGGEGGGEGLMGPDQAHACRWCREHARFERCEPWFHATLAMETAGECRSS